MVSMTVYVRDREHISSCVVGELIIGCVCRVSFHIVHEFRETASRAGRALNTIIFMNTELNTGVVKVFELEYPRV